MKCLNVIVFYNNYNDIIEYIEEVSLVGKNFVDIAIVINSDKFGDLRRLKEYISSYHTTNIQLYDFKENVGYLNAFLSVVKVVNIDEYDFLILSNTDISYRDKAFFEVLSKAHYDKEIGCIAPSVYAMKNDTFSNPHYLERIPQRKLRLLEKIFSFPRFARFYLWLAGYKGKAKKGREKPSCFVYSPHGCYMIFTRLFVKCIRNYLYGAVLYSEESAVGELLLKNNLKCYYDSTLKITHNESEVTGKIDYKARFKLWRESITYILREFYKD